MSDHSALARLDQVAQLNRACAGRLNRAANEMIAVSRIDPDPHQPRSDFAGQPSADAAASLHDFAQNLEAQGILQPLRVRRHPEDKDRFLVVIGERRLRAAIEVGLEEVPCIIERDADVAEPLDLLIRQFAENDQREPLSLYDQARAVHRMVREFGCPPARLQELLGRSKTWISNRLRIAEKSQGATVQALEEGLLGNVEACRLFDLLPEEQRSSLLATARKRSRPMTRTLIGRELAASRSAPKTKTKKPGPAPHAFCHLRLRPEEVARVIKRFDQQPLAEPDKLRDQLYTILRRKGQGSTRKAEC